MKLRAAAGRWIRPAAAKVPADAVHGDAVIGFRDGGEKSDDAEMLLLEQGVERHGAVFAAAPAEEDGFLRVQENLRLS